MDTEKEEIWERLKALVLTMNLDYTQQQKIMKLMDKPLLTTSDMTIIFQNTAKTISRWREEDKIDYVIVGGTYYYLWDEILRKLKTRKK